MKDTRARARGAPVCNSPSHDDDDDDDVESTAGWEGRAKTNNGTTTTQLAAGAIDRDSRDPPFMHLSTRARKD